MEKEISIIRDQIIKKGIKEFEITLLHSFSTTTEVKDQKLDALEKTEKKGVKIRVLNGGRLGFSFGTDFSLSAINHVIDQAFQSAASLQVDPCYSFQEKFFPMLALQNNDPCYFQLTQNEKNEALLSAEKAALHEGNRVKRVRYVSLNDSRDTVWILNHHGINLNHERTEFQTTIMPVVEEGTETESYFDQQYSPFWKDLKFADLGKAAATEALSRLGGKRLPTLKTPIILNSQVASEIIDVLSSSILAENVFKKNSFLIGKMGRQIYSPLITLLDDGLLPLGSESFPFDAEGTPCQKTSVIQKGVVQNFLYDLYWAGKMKASSTGNAKHAGYDEKPSLGTTNFYVEPGNTSLEAMCEQMKDGVLLTETIGMHTADEISGDFSVAVQGYRILEGKKAYPLRSMAWSGNLHEVFKKIVCVGSDLRFYEDRGSPSLWVEEGSLSGE